MAYVGELGVGSSIYIENQDSQTVITVITASPGQQQQTSHSFSIGHWTTAPSLFQYLQDYIIQLETVQGSRILWVQSGQIRQMEIKPPQHTLKPIALQQMVHMPSPSFSPLPLTMNNMVRSGQPLQMRIGNMNLSMGTTATVTQTSSNNYCSQCGASVATADKFCANCGHRLA